MATKTQPTPPRDYPEVQAARAKVNELRGRIAELERELNTALLLRRREEGMEARTERILAGESGSRPVAEVEADLQALRHAEMKAGEELSEVYAAAMSSFRTEVCKHLAPLHDQARKILRGLGELEVEVREVWQMARGVGMSDADPLTGDLGRIVRVMDAARAQDLVG